MMEFDSMEGLAVHFMRAAAAELIAIGDGLKRCAGKVEKDAKAEIGHYQSAVGPFQDWAELADSTEQDKAMHGYPVDAPLLRTGEMRDAITHDVDMLEAIIGTMDEGAGKILKYHEVGTSKMPPRPVLGPALFKNKEFIQKTMGESTLSGMMGGMTIHPALGYGD